MPDLKIQEAKNVPDGNPTVGLGQAQTGDDTKRWLNCIYHFHQSNNIYSYQTNKIKKWKTDLPRFKSTQMNNTITSISIAYPKHSTVGCGQ